MLKRARVMSFGLCSLMVSGMGASLRAQTNVAPPTAAADGQTPHPDPYGLKDFFHYSDDDEDFLASVMRTFMRDVDDIRVTLHHLTELDFIAARRVHRFNRVRSGRYLRLQEQSRCR